MKCRSCQEEVEALNADRECEECFREAMRDAYDDDYKSWPQSTPFEPRYLAVNEP